ncbi:MULTISPECIES: DUF2109 family protein [unclassified Methanothermobacter]|uniref:DUF2109 family protein n=1 Tax=unclassified Methanothermobacter TaxID=2631116 RepID=UPI0011C8C5BF|nr:MULTISPECIES: DUF2109 family protein [unclassified Methanothermobacter]QEF93760.1 DUF2109 domain-containing protein [Methanothermobacter sp. KEPCO-1]QHN08790.1 DUF2109 domain-containing protein [Methanothermobacter sp. THM-2]
MLIQITGIIVVLMALRALLAQDRAERLLYLNAMSFGISAMIALYIGTAFGAVLAAVYFVASTITSNAIAHTLDRVGEEILIED